VTQAEKRILIVDDDHELLKLMRVLLSRLDVEIIEATNAADAAQILRTQPTPDLLLLDLILPDVSGVELLKQIRAKPQFDRMLVIVLSAMIDPDEIRAALDAGADRYLTKPYISNNLVSVVTEVFRAGRRAQSGA